MILERDAFTVEYDASLTSLEDMYAAIRGLGYTPSMFAESNSDRGTAPANDEMPPLIANALVAAQAENKPLFLDFFAEWCVACKALDQQTLSSAEVQSALENYRVVKIDTDLAPASGMYFNIVGMPTLVVLAPTGEEIFRSVGPISATDLSDTLNRLQPR